jgi:hypothetical protein
MVRSLGINQKTQILLSLKLSIDRYKEIADYAWLLLYRR